jgi:hypothetical protein
MALARIELRIGGMTDRNDIRTVREALDAIAEIDAQDVRQGLVRLEYDPCKLDLNRVFVAIAQAGEGYDVSMG